MKEVQILVRDDLDGSLDASTVSFTWQGVPYEIDLSDKNIHELSELLRPYLEAARKVDQKRGRGRPRKSATPQSEASPPGDRKTYAQVLARKVELNRVREWANQNGMEFSTRARIPYDVHMAYNEAHPDDQVPLADHERFRNGGGN